MDSASADLAAPAGAAGPSSDAPVEHSRRHGSWAGLLWMIPVAALVLAADQLTKLWAVESLGYERTIDLFWTARFNLVRNEGAAFSLGSDFTPFIAVGAIVIAVTVIVVSRRVQRRSVLIALGLVLGGALGNLVDRVAREGSGFLRGAVVDFIDFQWWPVFNVADIAIVVGGMLLVLLMSDEVVPGSHDRHRSD